MSKPFFGGIPTDVDVRALREAFPNIQVGDEISYDDVAAIIGAKPRTNRFRTVVDAWRRDLFRKDNVELITIVGVGLRCASAEERVNLGFKKVRRGIVHQVRAAQRAQFVRTDDAVLINKQHAMMRLATLASKEFETTIRELNPPAAPTRNPLRKA